MCIVIQGHSYPLDDRLWLLRPIRGLVKAFAKGVTEVLQRTTSSPEVLSEVVFWGVLQDPQKPAQLRLVRSLTAAGQA